MITASRYDHTITRNSTFFKRIQIPNETFDVEESDTDSMVGCDNLGIRNNENVVNNEDPHDQDEVGQNGLRRSTRVTGQPVRYPMDVAT